MNKRKQNPGKQFQEAIYLVQAIVKILPLLAVASAILYKYCVLQLLFQLFINNY